MSNRSALFSSSPRLFVDDSVVDDSMVHRSRRPQQLIIIPLSLGIVKEISLIVASLRAIAAVTSTCIWIDETEERQALKNLTKAVKILRSDVMVYEVLMDTIKGYLQVIQQRDGEGAMEGLGRALKATRLLLEENPAGNRHETMMNPSASKKPRRAFNFVLKALKAKVPPGHRHELIGDLQDATNEIFMCQQNNKRAFKLVWNLYVVAQQYIGHPSSVYNVGNIQDRVGHALDSVLHAFHVHPFAVSPEGASQVNFAVLNHDHETATRHETLTRRIGRAWVDDRIRRTDKQVRDLCTLKTSLFELLWSGTVEQLKRHSSYLDDPEQPGFERAVEELENALQEGIVRSKKQLFTIAFCGMVNAGKSSFLNALMGRAILPSDGLPSTAWPCRLRHVEGQTVPALHFQAGPFLAALKNLQAHQYGRKMQTYEPPPKNVFEAPLADAPSEPSDSEIILRTIHSHWVTLHAVTRDNLLKFEAPEFNLPREATGEQNVKNLLGQLNDIVRLCQRFNLKFDMSEVDWLLLTVEFNSLRGHRMDGIYEFIDLPGIGDGFLDFNFESLARIVASESNAIVPIVSFTELARSHWKRLPDLVASGSNGSANMVICTHLDQILQENMYGQLETVTKTFWPRSVLNTNRVIPCSSLMGLSARYLLDKSSMTKPLFDTIWTNQVGYHCSAKILGVRDPRATYDRFDIQIWKDKLQAELRDSGLPSATQKLTKEMVDSARINALLGEVGAITRQIREISNIHGRKLLEDKNEYDVVKRRYDQTCERFQAVSDTWDRVESMQTREIRLTLEQELGMISQQACGLVNQTIKKTLQVSTFNGILLEDIELDTSSGKRGFSGVQLEDEEISGNSQGVSSAETGHGKVLVAKSRTQAEYFLHLCQDELNSALETLKRDSTARILDLAGTAKQKLLKVLRGLAKDAELQPLLEDWEKRIRDVEPPLLNVNGLIVQEIRGVIKSRSLFNRQYTIEMATLHGRFKGEAIDPWIEKMTGAGEKGLLGASEASVKAAKNLMVSALLERRVQYKRELEGKQKKVQGLIATCGNLLAAEEALRELFVRVEALKRQNGQ